MSLLILGEEEKVVAVYSSLMYEVFLGAVLQLPLWVLQTQMQKLIHFKREEHSSHLKEKVFYRR